MSHIFWTKIGNSDYSEQKIPSQTNQVTTCHKVCTILYHSATCYILHTPDTYAWVELLVNGEMRRQMPLHEFF